MDMFYQTLKLWQYKEIPVRVHWSSIMVLVLIFYLVETRDLSFREACVFSLLILMVFICVILHEFGHALVAKRYGVKTIDIVLLPIGGVARLESLPADPLKEILIAIAGPVVNLFIAFSIYIFFWVKGIGWIQPDVDFWIILNTWIGFLHLLLLINLASFCINLLPILPMDGGRVLRALLNFKMSRVQAGNFTRIISFIFLALLLLGMIYLKKF